jgi:hypothetical protein
MNRSLARRRHADPAILAVRPLVRADIDHLRSARTAIDPIKVIRDRHHHIAWLIALGKTYRDIAAEVGMTEARISVLMADPTFLELVEKRRAEIAEIRKDHTEGFVASATKTMLAAESLIQRRLDTAIADPTGEDTVALRDLNRIAADRMDRFGFGKHSTSESRNINMNFASKLEAAIERSRKTIEGN